MPPHPPRRPRSRSGTRSTNYSAEAEIRPVEEIEAEAETILKKVPDWIWNGEKLPVPVEDVADSCFGLLVRDVGDLATAPGAPPLLAGQSLSGLLLPTLGEIWVNEWEGSKWPGRRRFTIGHELGHWVMHSPGTKSIFCRSQSVQPEEEAPSIPPMEEEAQVFASRLLMPEHLVRKFAPDFRDDLDGLCALFGTSRVAMTRRLEDLQAS